MKTAVVTGAGGFIGGALTDELLKNGYAVIALIRDEKQKARFSGRKNLHPVVCDIENQEAIRAATGQEIEYFIHLAWDGVSGGKSREIEIQLSNLKAACMAMEWAKHLRAGRFYLRVPVISIAWRLTAGMAGRCLQRRIYMV